MKSEYFNHERQVLIYTPGGYQQLDQTYYDVIYVFDAQSREMFDAVCASCGKPTKVPFQPRNDKPIYCSECFAARRGR